MSGFSRLFVILSGLALGSAVLEAEAATTTQTFTVQLTITASCSITSASTLDFGSQGLLNSVIDATSTIQVQCTTSTPYNIGLDAGAGSGATVTTRKMTNGGSTVNYSIYSDTGRTTVWGNTIGSNTVTGTGTGSAQSFTVYGRVPVQTTPAAGAYSDTVTVTVTY